MKNYNNTTTNTLILIVGLSIFMVLAGYIQEPPSEVTTTVIGAMKIIAGGVLFITLLGNTTIFLQRKFSKTVVKQNGAMTISITESSQTRSLRGSSGESDNGEKVSYEGTQTTSGYDINIQHDGETYEIFVPRKKHY